MPSFQQQQGQQNYEKCKEIGKYTTYSGKKVPNRKCSWEEPDLGLSRQRLQSSYYKYIHIAKRNDKELPSQIYGKKNENTWWHKRVYMREMKTCQHKNV